MLILPTLLNPWHAAEQGMRIGGAVDLLQLPRVLDLLADDLGEVQCEFEFFVDAQRRSCVKGRVWGKVRLVCQRCLDPVEISIDTDLLLALVKNQDEVARLPAAYDPFIVTDSHIRPLDIVEEEILLAFPHIPTHADDKICSIFRNIDNGILENKLPRSEPGENPFQILEQIKDRLH